MSDAEIGQMRNGLGLSGKQLERYQTQRSIVIKKQADLVNCSALGSLAIEKGFETTVDKLLKELLKKAAGAVGGALGGAAAISGGIVIGMLMTTEEVGESKEELDEFVKEQKKQKEKTKDKDKSSETDKEGTEYRKPVSGKSGKEAANDAPSWAKGNRPRKGENGKDFAKRLMDEKYGKDNYDKGPGSEFNKIKKWGDRGFEK